MVYEFVGKIISAAERSGQSAKGPWKMWECTMQHDLGGQYPSYVAFEVWDEALANTILIFKGNNAVCKLSAYINARESNGKWWNSIRASKCEAVQQVVQQQPMQMAQPTMPYQGQQNPNAGGYAQQQGYGGQGVNPNTGLPF